MYQYHHTVPQSVVKSHIKHLTQLIFHCINKYHIPIGSQRTTMIAGEKESEKDEKDVKGWVGRWGRWLVSPIIYLATEKGSLPSASSSCTNQSTEASSKPNRLSTTVARSHEWNHTHTSKIYHYDTNVTLLVITCSQGSHRTKTEVSVPLEFLH